jgi:hypothetical protein
MVWSQIYTIDCPKFPYQFNLHGLSDFQIGSESTSLRIIKQRIEEICDDPVDCGTIIAGDIEEDDRPTTRIAKKSTFADRPEVLGSAARDHICWLDKEVIPLLLPLQKTKYGIMGILAGHHYTQLTPDLSSPMYICNRLKEVSGREVPYLGVMSSFMDIRFRYGGKGIRSVGHVQHGQGGGQTKGSTITKLDRTSQGFNADWYIRAHDCQLVGFKQDQLYPKMVNDGSLPDILSKTVTFLNLGAATQGYQPSKKEPSYVEAEMLRPTTLGWGTLHFKIRKAWQHEDPHQSYKVELKVSF